VNLLAINGIDFLITAIIIWGGISGFFRGLFRQVANFFVLYIATVLALQYYRPLARCLLGSSASAGMGANILIFISIVIFIYLFLGLVISDLLQTYGDQRSLSLRGLAELGGMSIGFIHASLGASLMLILLSISLRESWWQWEEARQMLLTELNHSALASLFINYLMQASAALQPWLPGGLPPLLANPL